MNRTIDVREEDEKGEFEINISDDSGMDVTFVCRGIKELLCLIGLSVTNLNHSDNTDRVDERIEEYEEYVTADSLFSKSRTIDVTLE